VQAGAAAPMPGSKRQAIARRKKYHAAVPATNLTAHAMGAWGVLLTILYGAKNEKKTGLYNERCFWGDSAGPPRGVSGGVQKSDSRGRKHLKGSPGFSSVADWTHCQARRGHPGGKRGINTVVTKARVRGGGGQKCSRMKKKSKLTAARRKSPKGVRKTCSPKICGGSRKLRTILNKENQAVGTKSKHSEGKRAIGLGFHPNPPRSRTGMVGLEGPATKGGGETT